MRFETPQPGMFVVTYRVSGDLHPAAQGPLIAAVEAALAKGPVVIVFEVGSLVRSVDLSVPTFWLDVTGRLALTGICIVTTSVGVRIAARGFKLAQNVRKHPIAVEVFDGLDDGLAWASGLLSSRG